LRPCAVLVANLQLSIKDNVAPTFELSNRDEVVANIVPRDSVLLEFVELTFKDQLISRSDMWRLKLSLQNQCVYVNKNISFGSMRVRPRKSEIFDFLP
jgi:DEP domain-containing protein 5